MVYFPLQILLGEVIYSQCFASHVWRSLDLEEKMRGSRCNVLRFVHLEVVGSTIWRWVKTRSSWLTYLEGQVSWWTRAPVLTHPHIERATMLLFAFLAFREAVLPAMNQKEHACRLKNRSFSWRLAGLWRKSVDETNPQPSPCVFPL